MLDHLRNIIPLISLGILLYSCSSDDPIETKPEMKFEVSSISRSMVTTPGNITASPFAVFGDRGINNGPNWASELNNVFYNTQVTYTKSGWTISEPQYWFDKHEHSFVAIHPASVLAPAGANIQYANNELSFTYTLPDNNAQTPDLLAATHRRTYIDNRKYETGGSTITGTAVESIRLKFDHLLAHINVAPAFDHNILDQNAYVEISKMQIKGYKSKATFKIKPASLLTADQTDDREYAVTDHDSDKSLTIEFAEPIKVKNDKQNVMLLASDDLITMLPQSFAANSVAQIVLTYKYSTDSSSKEVSIPLRGLSWEMGKSYTYRCLFTRRGVEHQDMTISGWESLSADGVLAR